MSAAGPPTDWKAERETQLRNAVCEALEGVSRNAEIAIMFFEMNDTVGGDYAVRCSIASLRAAVSVLAMLKNSKSREPANADSAAA